MPSNPTDTATYCPTHRLNYGNLAKHNEKHHSGKPPVSFASPKATPPGTPQPAEEPESKGFNVDVLVQGYRKGAGGIVIFRGVDHKSHVAEFLGRRTAWTQDLIKQLDKALASKNPKYPTANVLGYQLVRYDAVHGAWEQRVVKK